MCYKQHRWMVVDDYEELGVHIIKYKCVDCPKTFTSKSEECTTETMMVKREV